jgi:hypothetical protein
MAKIRRRKIRPAAKGGAQKIRSAVKSRRRKIRLAIKTARRKTRPPVKIRARKAQPAARLTEKETAAFFGELEDNDPDAYLKLVPLLGRSRLHKRLSRGDHERAVWFLAGLEAQRLRNQIEREMKGAEPEARARLEWLAEIERKIQAENLGIILDLLELAPWFPRFEQMLAKRRAREAKIVEAFDFRQRRAAEGRRELKRYRKPRVLREFCLKWAKEREGDGWEDRRINSAIQNLSFDQADEEPFKVTLRDDLHGNTKVTSSRLRKWRLEDRREQEKAASRFRFHQ